MSNQFKLEKGLVKQCSPIWDQKPPQQNIADLKREHPLVVRWKKLKTFLKHCVQSTERN